MKFSAKEVMHDIASKTGQLKEINGVAKERLQAVLSGMLKEIQSACEENGIEIVLCGGTCLGAVRHRGFIPWDDDVDIAIMRKDWDVLKSKFEEILGDRYDLEAPNYNNKDSKYPWAKIYMKGTELVDLIDINLPYNKGIFIDIFVIENISDYRIVRCFDAFVSSFMKYVATSMLFYRSPNKLMKQYFCSTFSSAVYYRLRQFMGFLFSFVSHKSWLTCYDKFISRHKKDSAIVTIPTGTHLYFGEMLPRTAWQPYSRGEFDGININIPNDADAYLTIMYGGDYMQLPPVEKRETHFIVSMKLPNGDTF